MCIRQQKCVAQETSLNDFKLLKNWEGEEGVAKTGVSPCIAELTRTAIVPHTQ